MISKHFLVIGLKVIAVKQQLQITMTGNANMKYENDIDEHLQLFGPWEIITTPLVVIRTFNVVNFNKLWDVWFPLDRTR